MAMDEPIRTHYKGQLKQRIDTQVWPPQPFQQANELKLLLINF
jgi:hypothetical protein